MSFCPLRSRRIERCTVVAFVEKGVPAKSYEHAVLVTDLDYEFRAIAQLWRDRGDAENAANGSIVEHQPVQPNVCVEHDAHAGEGEIGG